MTIHLIRDLEKLHRNVLSMCSVVESLIVDAVECLITRGQRTAADEVISRDEVVNRADVQIENECLKILALHQPVATDLRRITAVLKITGELERVADLGVNIAERAQGLRNFPDFAVPGDLKEMAHRSLDMLHRSIDSYIELDATAARKVCADDDAVDALNAELISRIREMMQQDPQTVEPALHVFSATRHIERVADHATNISEDVVYMVDGEIIRHGGPHTNPIAQNDDSLKPSADKLNT